MDIERLVDIIIVQSQLMYFRFYVENVEANFEKQAKKVEVVF
ncbi:hypothetical protein ACIQYG_06370 [Peribacillus sp. NPDC096622]